MFSHITFNRLFFFFFWPSGKVRVPGFKNRLLTPNQIYTNASKSGIWNDQLEEFFVQVHSPCAVTICRSFPLGPEAPDPVTYAARRHRHTLPGAARRPGRSSLRGNAAAPPPPGPPRGPRYRAGRRRPATYPAGPEPPGTQARLRGRAASAAMTATRGSTPRAQAHGPQGCE